MKTQILNKAKYLVILLMVPFIFSCSSDDSGPIAEPVTAPSISYTTNNIDAIFYRTGNSTPTIDWNGDTGTLELVGGTSGLDFNAATGEIAWTKLLGNGIWNFDIVATNSAGSTTIEITIDNTFQGVFIGNGSSVLGTPAYNLDLSFNKDGTAAGRKIFQNGDSSPFT